VLGYSSPSPPATATVADHVDVKPKKQKKVVFAEKFEEKEYVPSHPPAGAAASAEMSKEAQALEYKEQGNDAFKEKRYEAALDL